MECFAGQLGVCWAEMRPHYDSINEAVMRPETPQPAALLPRSAALHRASLRPALLPRVRLLRPPPPSAIIEFA